jgi:hypothetical protein
VIIHPGFASLQPNTISKDCSSKKSDQQLLDMHSFLWLTVIVAICATLTNDSLPPHLRRQVDNTIPLPKQVDLDILGYLWALQKHVSLRIHFRPWEVEIHLTHPLNINIDESAAVVENSVGI